MTILDPCQLAAVTGGTLDTRPDPSSLLGPRPDIKRPDIKRPTLPKPETIPLGPYYPPTRDNIA